MKRKTPQSRVSEQNHEAVWAGLRARGFEVHPTDGLGVAVRKPGNVTKQNILLGRIADAEVPAAVEELARLVTAAGERVLCSCCDPGVLEEVLCDPCDWQKTE